MTPRRAISRHGHPHEMTQQEANRQLFTRVKQTIDLLAAKIGREEAVLAIWYR